MVIKLVGCIEEKVVVYEILILGVYAILLMTLFV